jgi:chromosome condensin MukBEF MukE localization factor
VNTKQARIEKLEGRMGELVPMERLEAFCFRYAQEVVRAANAQISDATIRTAFLKDFRDRLGLFDHQSSLEKLRGPEWEQFQADCRAGRC